MRDITVLLIDDEERVLNALRRNLRNASFEQFYAGSGQEALDILAQTPVHVMVTDLLMPDMNGMMLLEKVMHEYPDVVRMVFSGQSEMSRIVTAINSGQVFRYVQKPVTDGGESLMHMIQEAIDFYLLRRERIDLVERLKDKNRELESTLAHVKTLEGLLPICAMCKKIRSDDDKDYWTSVEKYIQDRTDATFTHGYCPDCFKKHFADELAEDDS